MAIFRTFQTLSSGFKSSVGVRSSEPDLTSYSSIDDAALTPKGDKLNISLQG